MSEIPLFEKVAILGNNPNLIAEISSHFTRAGRYLPVLDRPRMGRSDSSNEIIRRHNALVLAQIRRVVLVDVPDLEAEQLSRQWPDGTFIQVRSQEQAEAALKGWTKRPKAELVWGRKNIGVGLLIARRSKKYLRLNDGESPTTTLVSNGEPLLIVCEDGDELAQVLASNLAFAMNAALSVMSGLPPNVRDSWLEEIYAAESHGNLSERIANICDRARQKLPDLDFSRHKQVLFITNGFPWGMAMPERPTTHMFAYPDLGRSIIEGLWATHHPSGSARTALLIDPGKVVSSEIERIRTSLVKNRTLVRTQAGSQATAHRVTMLVETLPFDVIVISTHAGDISGMRVTYEFADTEGITRRLVIDHAVGFSYDPQTSKFLVQQFERFHELDGVDWTDADAKKNLYVGAAINSWVAFDYEKRRKCTVATEPIGRVAGSMGLKMSDDVWFPFIHGFSSSCAPVIVNNACSSWHELSGRFAFAGSRAYIGTLFPVMDLEAQQVAISIFEEHLGEPLSKALWSSQNSVYGAQRRRPYAMVGLPCCSIRRNATDSIAFLHKEYGRAIAELRLKSEKSPFAEIRENTLRMKNFLIEDLERFRSSWDTERKT